MFERNSRIIRDGESLSFDYVPDKVVLREAQMGELERMFSPLAMDNRACSAYLWVPWVQARPSPPSVSATI